MKLLPSSSSLCLPYDRPINPRDKVLKKGYDFLFRKPADQEDGKLMFQNNHLFDIWMPGCFIEHGCGKGEEIKLEILQNGEGEEMRK